MPGSKTDTAIRFPESETQKRRLRNVTQDRKAVARMQDEAASAHRKAEDKTTWSPQDLLGTNIDESGNPAPNPASYADGNRAKQSKRVQESDMYGAMNENFD